MGTGAQPEVRKVFLEEETLSTGLEGWSFLPLFSHTLSILHTPAPACLLISIPALPSTWPVLTSGLSTRKFHFPGPHPLVPTTLLPPRRPPRYCFSTQPRVDQQRHLLACQPEPVSGVKVCRAEGTVPQLLQASLGAGQSQTSPFHSVSVGVGEGRGGASKCSLALGSGRDALPLKQ